MPTYNGEKYIEEAIQSVLDQTFTNFEFLIIDDGSTDNTAAIINSFKDERITYIKKHANTGIAHSLNLGIDKAKGKFIARMDDDDVSMPTRFEKQIEIFNIKPEIIVCGSSVYSDNNKLFKVSQNHELVKIQLLFYNPCLLYTSDAADD